MKTAILVLLFVACVGCSAYTKKYTGRVTSCWDPPNQRIDFQTDEGELFSFHSHPFTVQLPTCLALRQQSKWTIEVDGKGDHPHVTHWWYYLQYTWPAGQGEK